MAKPRFPLIQDVDQTTTARWERGERFEPAAETAAGPWFDGRLPWAGSRNSDVWYHRPERVVVIDQENVANPI